MDWSKAKNILIIAMIFTNLILMIGYYEDRPKEETLEKDYILETERMLDEYGIKLSCSIPDYKKRIAPPYITEDKIDLELLEESFFKGQSEWVKTDDHTIILSHNSENLFITDGEMLLYTNASPNDFIKDFNEESAKDYAEEFGKQKGVFPENASFDLVIKSGINYRIFYSSEIMLGRERVKLEDTKLEFIVSQMGVMRMERSWLKIAESGNNPIYINTAPKALRSLVGDSSLKGKEIIDISLCCYWDRYNWMRGDKIDSIRGISNPAWRVLFSDGEERILKSK